MTRNDGSSNAERTDEATAWILARRSWAVLAAASIPRERIEGLTCAAIAEECGGTHGEFRELVCHLRRCNVRVCGAVCLDDPVWLHCTKRFEGALSAAMEELGLIQEAS